MKTNIHRQNYDGTPNKNGHWWVWRETCDRCGKLIFDESVQHSFPKEDNKLDFCNECYRYLIDNDIPYAKAEKMFSDRKC